MPFNNGPKIVTTGLSLLADASDQLSYPGSGTAWTDVITGTTASLSGSISFTTDFQGSLVTANSSSVIIFPPSTANFGTNTFTVEFAFRPSQINGQHWILSKNSGSFPNWGVFVTGSSGSGRLVAFFNISSTISCSLVSPTASITTGSNYIVDASLTPNTNVSRLYINSEIVATGSANGTGSLSATSPLFFSNLNSGSNSGIVNNVFNIKAYTPKLNRGLVRQNYNAIGNRLGLPSKLWVSSVADSLLDFYPGAAAAYSLRQLSSDYDGFAIRVRRSSDNTETNIGFDNSGNLDTVTLLNFCGVGNGFVTTWYDQSGNGRDATQSTGANQPQIVSSGSVITENGKPNILFNGTTSFLKTASSVISTNFSIYAVGKTPSSGSNRSGFIMSQYAVNDANRTYFAIDRAVDTTIIGLQIGDQFDNKSGTTVFNQKLYYWDRNSSSIEFADNNNTVTTASNNTTAQNSALGFGGFEVGSRSLINIQEAVLYTTSNTSNRSGISTNINSFYNIY
jgi:hypothetical protein